MCARRTPCSRFPCGSGPSRGEPRGIWRRDCALLPDDPELHFHLAHLLTETGDYAEAQDSTIERVLGSPTSSGHFSSVDMGILGYKTYHNLGGLCLLQGDYAQAKEWFERAIDAAPQFLPSAFALFDAALSAGDHVTARHMLAFAEQQEGVGGNWTEMALRYAEAVGGEENGWLFLEQVVGQHPHAIAPRLLLARRLLQSEQEREALPHLLRLNEQGVSEAAYCLGVVAIRAGDLPHALQHMERALSLNPGHAQTQEQVTYLRQALGLEAEPEGEADAADPAYGKTTPAGAGGTCASVCLEDALEQLAHHFGLDAAELQAYAAEDGVGGYGTGMQAGRQSLWPGGSVWEEEGKALYALVRALRPRVIVEVGSLVGCSTSHLALACLRNGAGTVYAVDPAADLSRVSRELRHWIFQVREDVFTWTPPEGIDFVFEDGAHTPGFTQAALKHLRPNLSPNAAVLCHDACQQSYGRHILPELRAVMGEHADAALITPSDCGLGFARHPRPEAPGRRGVNDIPLR